METLTSIGNEQAGNQQGGGGKTATTGARAAKTSIVVAAHDAERFLWEALDRVRAQTDPDWECVLVDDGSADLTAAAAQALARREPRLRVLTQPRQGVSAARNAALAATDPHAEFLVFLDADDVWEPDALATLRAALEARPDTVGVYGAAFYLDACGRTFGNVGALGDGPQGFAADLTGGGFGLPQEAFLLPPGAFLLRRWACEAAGPFDAAVPGCEDWDLWLRLSLFGPLAAVPETVIGYRRHEHNITDRERLTREGRDRLLLKAEAYRRARRAALVWLTQGQASAERAGKGHEDGVPKVGEVVRGHGGAAAMDDAPQEPARPPSRAANAVTGTPGRTSQGGDEFIPPGRGPWREITPP